MERKIIFCKILITIFLGYYIKVESQIISGPYLGQVTTEQAYLWVLLKKCGTAAEATLQENGQTIEQYSLPINQELFPVKKPAIIFTLKNLKPATKYSVSFSIDGKKQPQICSFSTPNSNHEDTVTMLLGSCMYIGKGFFSPLNAFTNRGTLRQIAKEPPTNFLWLGDNVYYLPGYYWKNYKRMYLRNVSMRRTRVVNNALRPHRQFAIWDDHDFGPNDGNGDFDKKDNSLKVFHQFWPNPKQPNQGSENYFTFSMGVIDFFCLDGRYYRTPQDGPSGEMFGKTQINWLVEELKKSNAQFKCIVSGTQVLNEITKHESFAHYTTEFNNLLELIRRNKISGVIFLSGDKHHSEAFKVEKENLYPLYEFTNSPLTSWLRPSFKGDVERNNPIRIPGSWYRKHNYGKFTCIPKNDTAELNYQVISKRGKVVWSIKLLSKDLTY